MIGSAILAAGVLVAASVAWAAVRMASELRARRGEAGQSRALQLLALFAPAIAAARRDPRELLVWQPLAAAARRLFPDAFALLDAAAGASFPFTGDQIQAAHATWTADWLAWERAHDDEFKLRASAAERELAASGGGALERARLESVEREKLETYQRRYEDYIRVARALQALVSTA